MSDKRGPSGVQVEILDREECYRGFFRMEKYRLRHRLYNGGMSPQIERELFERGHAAAVLLYDPHRDRVVVLEQFRIGALEAPGGPWLLEIVAGMIEPGELAEEVVRRESQEEAGCSVGELEFICDYLVSPGGTSERISLYCGRVESEGAGGVHGLDSEDEDILVRAVPFAEAWQWFEQGEINSASPIIALQWLKMHRERLRERWR
ncbi:MAG: ADP-ribose diphosphatase [Gammaproteobacteria bacterium]|nr:ADP-ribose diphosphatase [Gammaproteobacteria bacterium]MCW8839522.1 ADP-ribose diphosphatase [Gammaproteobacteria bacterium]MCW8928446.1 ADP-ribose diphosphatase [Gammaproteobacteria bacterium]MCW8959599.1 ADP-ribose diphosphatase [Gammaproteobacteria bacterium]MCW8971841.1 ADP-ribose diphosphatase [Gammaproteobacteria bacterium]